jgi:hypothetical protein
MLSGLSGIVQFLEEETTCSIAQQARSVRRDRHDFRKSQGCSDVGPDESPNLLMGQSARRHVDDTGAAENMSIVAPLSSATAPVLELDFIILLIATGHCVGGTKKLTLPIPNPTSSDINRASSTGRVNRGRFIYPVFKQNVQPPSCRRVSRAFKFSVVFIALAHRQLPN